jgi:protein phosphatase
MSETPAQSESYDTEIEDLVDTKPENEPIDAQLAMERAKRLRLNAALRSDVGAVRQRNEDSCLMYSFDSGGHVPLPPFGLYIVADGMGGYHGGERASKIASRTAAQLLLQQIYLPLVAGESENDSTKIEQIMRESVLSAHKAVHPDDYSGNGGTTLTIALVLDRQLFLAHVGDSRAYWLVNNELKALTRDHSLVQRLQDEGKLSPEEAQNYQYRNVLLRALGQEEELIVDTYLYELPTSGKLMLCSDGLCGLVTDAELLPIMDQPLLPGEIADQLIAAALEAGGPDNITAVVVDFAS